MDTEQILDAIDGKIGRLQQIKALLTGPNGGWSASGHSSSHLAQKRVMSAEARARISAAQKKRWASQKKTRK